MLENCIKQRVLILDGAMGTMIQRYKLSEEDYRGSLSLPERQYKGNNDMLCVTQPHVISEIHRAYLEAGADIIETCTFNATSVSMEDYGMESFVRQINLAGAAIARKAADEYTAQTPHKPRFVAGSVGPTNKTCSISPDVNNPAFRAITYDQLRTSYVEQIVTLLEGGVDALLIETIFDTLNAKAALHAAEEAMEQCARRVPIMLSITLSESGRSLTGQTLSAFIASVQHAPLLSVGLNCSFGARDMKPYIKELSKTAPYYVSAYPNAGLPNQLGEYDESPETMAEQVKEYIDEGLVNIIGGCCGTTPQHIARYQELIAASTTLRTPSTPPTGLRLSGLELLEVKPENNFLNIGERCNVAGSRKFLRLIKEKNYEEAVEIARQQVEDGAQVIDINMDDGLLDAQAEMTVFLNLLMSEPEIARVPIMIDSSKFDVIEAGLKCVQGKCIVNSISLKEGEELFLARAATIRRLGAAVIVMAFDEKGQADNFERRTEVCSRAYHLLVDRLAFNPDDIIFDPNVLAIATGMDEHRAYAVDFIRTIEWIKQNLPHARIVGGISNLSFSLRGNNHLREVMHSVFLYHAIRAGMDMGIVNPAESVIYEEIPANLLEVVEDVILNRRDDATERLIDYASRLCEAKNEEQESNTTVDTSRHTIPLAERLKHALVRGVATHLEADLEEALEEHPSPLTIIDTLLMPAMNHVGELFGQGKMFLPQVVKTARTMKKAVSILQPYINNASGQKPGSISNKKIVLATVKGDVHDIGKNIVGVILACNGFEVIDLGVMVSAETIVKETIAHQANAIGLSGLITPSLDEMCSVATAMQAASLTMPLLIGGAATSKLHCALKIDPCYKGVVTYVKDASVAPSVLSKLTHNSSAKTYSAEIKQSYKRMRENYNQPNQISLVEAHKKRLRLDWSRYKPSTPKHPGLTQLEFSVQELIPLINWRMFFYTWKFDTCYADSPFVQESYSYQQDYIQRFEPAQQDKAREALKLAQEANAMLNKMVRREATVDCLLGVYPAYGTATSIVIDAKQKVGLLTPRQCHTKGVDEPQVYYALSDFVAPNDGDLQDYAGLFATTVGDVIRVMLEQQRQAEDDFGLMLTQSIADRLAEAAAELLHIKARQEFWGFNGNGIRPAVGYPSLPDHRLIFDINLLMDLSKIGIKLTENGAMTPNASICGLLIAHPEARYFSI